MKEQEDQMQVVLRKMGQGTGSVLSMDMMEELARELAAWRYVREWDALHEEEREHARAWASELASIWDARNKP